MAGGRTFLLAAAAIGLALRLAFGLGYWNDKPLTRDEEEYLSLARSLAAGDGFVFDAVMRSGPVDPFGRAPAYPAFLALVGGGRGVPTSVPTPVKVAQSFVGALGVVLAGLVAARLGGPRAGRAAALVAACHPPLVWIAAYAMSEAIFWPLALAAVWLFDRAVAGRTPALAWAIAAGAVIGAGALTRSALLLFLPMAGVWLLARRRIAVIVALGLGAALVVAPWTLRNYFHHGRLVVVASDGGVTFWTGNHPLAIGEGDMAANPALKLESQALRARHPGVSQEQMEPIYYREALAWIAAHPIDWLVLEVRKLFYLVVPIGPSYTLHSTRYYVASVVSYGFLLIAAIAGITRLRPLFGRTPGLWLLGASAVVTCLIFFPQERFRIPAIDPMLAIAVSAAWAGRGREPNP